jgi:hypothetical protein
MSELIFVLPKLNLVIDINLLVQYCITIMNYHQVLLLTKIIQIIAYYLIKKLNKFIIYSRKLL